ncbi:hypothetical protein DERP_000541 [Dermatophagoides pteronyssinus]|uniref:Uncharacterized protein n=1 Tax=Dermatophagoides pteronyssinus TaxID=6956 RepID=A0ABQ8J0G0_DERPT|nr:hypothetical protein DERP_000541 [Dermatophagoides pteronyssinus]
MIKNGKMELQPPTPLLSSATLWNVMILLEKEK